jgi:leucyl-tRNA---protein transferase
MESLFRVIAPPHVCGYLPSQTALMEYERFSRIRPAEYMARLRQGWRRFGSMLFRPQCQSCNACQSLRVLVNQFRPDRSQRRARKANVGEMEVRIAEPTLDQARIDLYDRFHAFQTDAKGWPAHPPGDVATYAETFLDNPFPTQEWSYYLRNRLIAVGFVDNLPNGLSAIYTVYDPEERQRSLGTWHVLNLIEYAVKAHLPHVYLGYFVADCGSMVYKARFRPNEVLGVDGKWHSHVD